MSKGTGEDDEGDRKSFTLFISNLSYATTKSNLEQFFSDIAPIRNAFIVTRRDLNSDEATSKGVGYVSFALKEDALDVLKQYQDDPKHFILDGRTIRVEAAHKKDSMKVRADKRAATTPKDEAASVTSAPATPHLPPRDKAASRTLVIILPSPPPTGTTQKLLWKKIRKLPGAQSLSYPVDSSTSIAHAVFESGLQAQQAAAKLHAHVWKGAMLSTIVKKKADEFGRKGKGGGKDARLIVRNLPKNITEEDLRRVFLHHVPIHSVHIPQPSGSSHNKPRFAFVQLYTKEDAEKAISRVNGTRVAHIPAPVMIKIEDVMKEEELDDPLRTNPPGPSTTTLSGPRDSDAHVKDEGDDVKPDREAPHEPSTSKSSGRIVAVDWALSKVQWEQMRSQEQTHSDVKDEDVAVKDQDRESDDGSASSRSLDEHLKFEDQELKSEQDSSDGDEEDMDKEEDESTSQGTTLFVRNLPFEATDEDLGVLFKTFGPIRYARVTLDPATERSRGTGFVSFWKKETADAVLEEASKLATSFSSGVTDNSLVKTSLSHSILTPDPSSSIACRLVLMGRTLNVTRAVTRSEASHLRDTAEKQREKKDTRNLYLLREGVIFADSPAASTIPPIELKKRLKAYEDRRASLRTNPTLFISKTRLSVRNLPTWVTDRGLKKLATYAVKQFAQGVEAGEMEDLSHPEKEDDIIAEIDQGQPPPSKKAMKAGHHGWSKTHKPFLLVKQAKIARASDRHDLFSPTGAGRSNGFGFLEMGKHSDALRVLRWTNNRNGVVDVMRGWWKEELKENIGRLRDSIAKGKAKDQAVGKGVGVHHAITDEDGQKAKLQLWERALKEMVTDDGDAAKTWSKPLLLEFSIENKAVVNLRAEKLKRSQAPRPDVSKPNLLGVKRQRRTVEQAEEDAGPELKRFKAAVPELKRGKNKSRTRGP